MAYKAIEIAEPSPRVLGKLRKGQKVRLMSGSGMSLVVRADRYNPITKSFGKGKAYTISLTPEEINANMNVPEEVVGGMVGRGIFDTIKKGIKAVGRVAIPAIKDFAKKGVSKLAELAPEIGSTLGSSALSGLALLAGQPELVPFAMKAGASLGRAGGKALGGLAEKKAVGVIDRFDPYQEQRGNAPPSRGTATNVMSSNEAMALTSPVGRANIGQYLHSLSSEDIEGELARRRGGGYSTPYDQSGGRQVLAPYTDAVGRGLGMGLGSGGGLGMGMRGMGHPRSEKSSVGIHGNLLGAGLPPALMSQPYSANFQMASRLPPAFSPLFHSGM